MQSISPVTPAQLLAAGQVPLLKLEIYVGAAWVNLCALDAKNYVEDISVSLGGASMTPNPIGGKLDAMLSNEDSIFHPQHPTSAYKDYLKTGRKVRASIGAKYGGTDYYWQRVIGYMGEPKFTAPDYKVSIGGGDYMKFLQDAEFGNLDNYWGTSQIFSSISSDGKVGIELYNEADAMDIPPDEADNVANWVNINVLASTFESLAEEGGGSAFVGKLVTTDVYDPEYIPTVANDSIFVPVVGKEYVLDFKYMRIVGTGARLRVRIRQLVGAVLIDLSEKDRMYSLAWEEEKVYFTAQSVNPIQIWLEVYEGPIGTEYWVDQFSIHEFIPYWERHYQLPVGAKGPYRVLLNDEDVWQGETDEGWYYTEDAEPGPDPPAHPARIVFFDPNKKVAVGTDNLVIHYFEAEAPENVVADILAKTNLYADRAEALADMEFTPTEKTIDRIWFKAGSPYLNAIKKLCERCDYRFHFKWDGTPVFKPKPAPETTAFTFTHQKHISSFSNYQDRGEIKNRVVIEGIKQAEPVNKEETLPPELRGEANDPTSIGLYGERTLTIKNHLFQDQTSIDAMCASLLAEYKDPKWYTDVEVSFNPVPLELGDEISWKERLSPTLEIMQTGVIRDIKIDSFNTTYKCEID